MLMSILLMATIPLAFNGCAKEPVYVKDKKPELQTYVVPKSEAETKKLNIKYRVVEK